MVYVDPLTNCKTNPRWKWSQVSHLFADHREELLDFAARIGLQVRWFQNSDVPHFDLTAGKREQAVRCGAFELEQKAAVNKMREIRKKNRNAKNGKESAGV